MSIFDEAIKNGLSAIKNIAGITVKYSRGSNFANVCAVVGTSRHTVKDEFGGAAYFVSRDYLIDVSDLPFGLPVKGDLIEENDGHSIKRYAASRPDGEPIWSYSDNARTRVRINTQLDSQGNA